MKPGDRVRFTPEYRARRKDRNAEGTVISTNRRGQHVRVRWDNKPGNKHPSPEWEGALERVKEPPPVPLDPALASA